jgi:hypothetical protein
MKNLGVWIGKTWHLLEAVKQGFQMRCKDSSHEVSRQVAKKAGGDFRKTTLT